MQATGVLNRKQKTHKSANHRSSLLKTVNRYRLYYALLIPGILFFLLFYYVPMFGIVIAFKDVAPFEGIKGILDGPWVGFKHFKDFFSSIYFWNVLGNTFILNFYRLIVGYPLPIILAILINEVANVRFKRTVQTISYLPHFISAVVFAGIVTSVFTTEGGIVNEIIKFFGGKPIYFLGDSRWFRHVFVASSVWQQLGWNTIIYLAAITGIDPQLYESAVVDGANKFKQMLNVTIPGIFHVMVVLFILRIGEILTLGFEQVLLLYSPPVYNVADIIDTFVYREGLINFRYSYATAVALFKGILALVLVQGTNIFARKIGQRGIW